MPWSGLTEKLTPEQWSAIMAFIFAILRILGEKEDYSDFTLAKLPRMLYRMLLEGTTCMLLAAASIPIVEAVGFGPSMNVPVGAFIGYFGSQTVRLFALRFINHKVDKK